MTEMVRTAFWTIGRGLDPSVYKDKIGQVTNFALRVLGIRAQHKMGDKRLTYGKLLRDLNAHIQEMTGVEVGDTLIVWPDPLPENPLETTQELQAEVAMGIVSRQTAAEQVGRDWEMERERIQNESKERSSLGQYLIEQFDRGGNAESRPPQENQEEEDDGQTD